MCEPAWDERPPRGSRPIARSSHSKLFVAAAFAGRLIVSLVLSTAGALFPIAGFAAVTIGGPFALSAPDGKIVTDRSFPGKWLLVYFGYTSCPDSCPTALAEIAKTLAKLGADAVRLQPVFITLDPRRDTQAVMGDYVLSFDPRILGLTGTADQIGAVAHAYGAYAEGHTASGDEGSIDHSVYIYLMNPSGAFVRAFDPSWSADRMAAVLRATMIHASPAAPDDKHPVPDGR